MGQDTDPAKHLAGSVSCPTRTRDAIMTHTPPTPDADPGRRHALQVLSVALGGIGSAAIGLPFVGYLLGPLLQHRPDVDIDLGPVDEFPNRETRLKLFVNPYKQSWDGDTQKGAAYVRRLDGDDFEVFAIFCTHLGCPVSWFPESGLFLCPCHGGAYYENGERASGPPPQRLYRYAHHIDDKRHLFIKGGHLPTLQDPPAQAAGKENTGCPRA